MSKIGESQKLIKRVQTAVSAYLDNHVSKPALETVANDPMGQARVANLKVLIHAIFDDARVHGIDYDKDFLASLATEEVEERIKVLREFTESKDPAGHRSRDVAQKAAQYMASGNSRKFIFEYVKRELNWIVVSTLSASYVSALILMRSVLELLVGIATHKTGNMRDRVGSIACFDKAEKKRLTCLWDRLCAWSHPYGKWVKEVCPVYSGLAPIYHPKLFGLCLDELMELADLLATVVVTKYELEPARLATQLNEERIDLAGFRSLSRWLLAEPGAAPNVGSAKARRPMRASRKKPPSVS